MDASSSLQENILQQSNVASPMASVDNNVFEQDLSADMLDDYIGTVSFLDVLLVVLFVVFLWMLYQCYKQSKRERAEKNKKPNKKTRDSLFTRIANVFVG